MDWYAVEVKKVPALATGMPTYGTPALVASIGKMLGAMGSYNHQTEWFEQWELISGERLKRDYWVKDTGCPACLSPAARSSEQRKASGRGQHPRGPSSKRYTR